MRKVKKTSSKPGRVTRRPTLDVSAHAGRWVVFDPQTLQIIGHGASPDDALSSAAKLQGAEPVLYYVPTSDAFFVGHGA